MENKRGKNFCDLKWFVDALNFLSFAERQKAKKLRKTLLVDANKKRYFQLSQFDFQNKELGFPVKHQPQNFKTAKMWDEKVLHEVDFITSQSTDVLSQFIVICRLTVASGW